MDERKIYLNEYNDLGINRDIGNPVELYLDLMKRILVNIIYEDTPYLFYGKTKKPELADSFALDRRIMGEDFPTKAHTCVGMKRLDNIQYCAEQILKNNIPGDFLEAGVGRGGASIFMRSILKVYGIKDRKVVACDAFSDNVGKKVNPVLLGGLVFILSVLSKAKRKKLLTKLQRRRSKDDRSFPAVNDPSDEWTDLVYFGLKNNNHMVRHSPASSLKDVKSHFSRYNLFDEQTVFLKGFFEDTLQNAPVDQIALLRLDGDTYESTKTAIDNLYPKLSQGGFCIVDDYYSFSDCQKAIDEYRENNNMKSELKSIDNMSCYWKHE